MYIVSLPDLNSFRLHNIPFPKRQPTTFRNSDRTTTRVLLHSTKFCNEHATPVPLPYLHLLFKKYACSYTELQWYIFPPVSWFVNRAIESAQEGLGPEMASVRLAEAKQEFTEDAYLSGASTELKKDLYAIPLDDLFGKCAHQLLHKIVLSENDDEKKQREIADQICWYLLQCGAYHDKALGEAIECMQAYVSVPHLSCKRKSDHDEQKALLHPEVPWPGMVQVLNKALVMHQSNGLDQVRFDNDNMASVIRQLIQFAMNCCDAWIRASEMTTVADRLYALCTGFRVIKWAWDNMLNDPCSDVL